jgi:putative heme iron utilization protein
MRSVPPAARACQGAAEGRGYDGPALATADELRTLRAAYRERVRRDAAAHVTMADRFGEMEHRHEQEIQQLRDRIADLEAQNADLRSEVAGKDEELRGLLSTKTFRYSAALRRLYGRLRGAR